MTPLEIAGVLFIVFSAMRSAAWLLIQFGHWLQDGESQNYIFYIRTSALREDVVKLLQRHGHFVIEHEDAPNRPIRKSKP